MSGSSAPLYQQVSAAIRDQIVSGHRNVGSMLPTEHTLARSFKVSRATIRKAIRGLKDEGLVRATPGVGTVVVRKRPQKRFGYLRTINDDLDDRGIPSTIELLSATFREPNDAVREHLHVEPGGRVLEVVRIRRIASQPFSITYFHVPEWVGVDPEADFKRPVHEYVERARRHFITYGTDRVSARSPTPSEQEMLEIGEALPVLIVRRTSFTDYDQPVEFVESVIRSDLFDYVVTLPRKPDADPTEGGQS